MQHGAEPFLLDPQQNEAASLHQGAIAVFAGPGSGKTRTLVERTARMIESGIPVRDILLLTFSRKAVREMFVRLRERLGNPPKDAMPVIENFHSFGWKLIQAAPVRYGLRPGVTLLDDSDQKRFFRQAMKEVGLTKDHGVTLNGVMSFRDALASDGIDPLDREKMDLIKECAAKSGIKHSVFYECLESVTLYEKLKKQSNVVDFGDLITIPVGVCHGDVDFSTRLSSRFKYISVDEVQDTSQSQYDMIRILSSAHGNTFVVGDDDQCIYGWRGARVENLNRFIEEYDAKAVYLERNYRSVPNIVDLSSSFIQKNDYRVNKSLFSNRGSSKNAPCAHFFDESRDMANAIANDVEIRLRAGARPKDIAVLYRTNRIGLLLEPAFIARGIPYHVAQGVDLFARQEAQMLMAAVRASINPWDEPAVRKLISGMIIGVGEKTIDKLFDEARMNNVPLLDAHVFMKAKGKLSIEDLSNRIQTLKNHDPCFLAQWALDPELGSFGDWLEVITREADNPSAALEKRLNTLIIIQESIRARLDSMPGLDTAAQWMEVASMGISAPDEEMDRDAVMLETAYKAKGLEYRHVYIAGASERIMPMIRTQDDDDIPMTIEEERRVMYVSMTRAMETLFIAHAQEMNWGFKRDIHEPSMFIDEMNIEVIDHRRRMSSGLGW